MENKDIEILKAVYHGNHLSEKEILRADELIKVLSQTLKLLFKHQEELKWFVKIVKPS